MVEFRGAVKPFAHCPHPDRLGTICPLPDRSLLASAPQPVGYRLAWIMLLLASCMAFDKALPSGAVSGITRTPGEGDAQ